MTLSIAVNTPRFVIKPPKLKFFIGKVSLSPSEQRWKCSQQLDLVPLSGAAEGKRDCTNDSRNGPQVLGKNFLHVMLQLLLLLWIKAKLEGSLKKTVSQRMVLLDFFNLIYLIVGKARRKLSVFVCLVISVHAFCLFVSFLLTLGIMVYCCKK